MVPRNSTKPSGYWWLAPMACATRSSGSRLIMDRALEPSITNPSGPSTRIASSQRRTSSMLKCVVEQPDERADRRSSRCCPWPCPAAARCVPRNRAGSRRCRGWRPVVSPRLLTASTISGSGLFQWLPGWMPTSAPVPTALIGCDLVKISASGPMPTSRYCDHMPWAISTSFSRCASGEPGRTAPRSSPITATTEARTDSARLASPRACSSITRSSIDATKVTPAALIACRSQGARSQGESSTCAVHALLRRTSSVAAMRSPRWPRTAAAGSGNSSSALEVAASRDRSYTPSGRTCTSTWPAPGRCTRPIKSALSVSAGRAAAGKR